MIQLLLCPKDPLDNTVLVKALTRLKLSFVIDKATAYPVVTMEGDDPVYAGFYVGRFLARHIQYAIDFNKYCKEFR